MDVYFGENFWGCERGRHRGAPGEEIYLEERFLWNGREVRIPSVYVCEKGLVADFCICIPAEETAAFLNRWRPRLSDLSAEEEEQLEWENPMSEDLNVSLSINGEEAESCGGCGVCWYPPYLRGDEAREAAGREKEMEEAEGEDEEVILMKAYGCSPEESWRFWRMSFGWPAGKRAPVRTLSFAFEKGPDHYAGIHFTVSMGEENRQVEFCHPATGERHVLTVYDLERQTIPEKTGKRLKFEKIPVHFLMMNYTVEPGLPEGELTLRDCAESDPPVMKARKGKGGVSVIGGAVGPTAIFFAGKTEERPSLAAAFSSVHYEPVSRVEWRMVFQVKNPERKRIDISLTDK